MLAILLVRALDERYLISLRTAHNAPDAKRRIERARFCGVANWLVRKVPIDLVLTSRP